MADNQRVRFVLASSPSGPIAITVDAEDFDYLSRLSWHMTNGYVGHSAKIDGRWRPTYIHRHVALRMGLIDELVPGEGGLWQYSIDHINGDKLDNRRSNLALKSRSQQMSNENDGLRRTNSSGYRGVSYYKRKNKWEAYVSVDGRKRRLGYFDTAEEAAEARRLAR